MGDQSRMTEESDFALCFLLGNAPIYCGACVASNSTGTSVQSFGQI